MNPRRPTHQIITFRRSVLAVRRLVGIVAALTLVFGQVVSASASHTTNLGGEFVEICGENGIQLIQLPVDDQDHAPQCQHCDPCVNTVSSIQSLTPAQSTFDLKVGFSVFIFPSQFDLVIHHPEYFKPQNRGPPFLNKNNQVTTRAVLFFKAPNGSPFSRGGVA